MRESIGNSTVGLSLGQPISVGFCGPLCTTSGAHDWLTNALWVKPNKEIVLRKVPTLGLYLQRLIGSDKTICPHVLCTVSLLMHIWV